MRDPQRFSSAILGTGLILMAVAVTNARADDSPEQRLRDALRQSVTEMRAAQDQAAQATAQVAQLQADKAALQAQVDAAKVALAQAAKPDELKSAQAALDAAHAQAAQMAGDLTKWQGAYQQANAVAQSKDAESRKALQSATANARALQTCKATNTKLISLSESVLHLYETQGFRNILLKSYEPLIGSAKVDLENLVQDYDDKIHDQEYIAPVSGTEPAGKGHP